MLIPMYMALATHSDTIVCPQRDCSSNLHGSVPQCTLPQLAIVAIHRLRMANALLAPEGPTPPVGDRPLWPSEQLVVYSCTSTAVQ
eukprot:COSAG02_NODE_35011_length_475_cov_0.827128_2_plen_85_part_01